MTGIEILTGWFLIAAVNLAATMSPGPAFAITLRNAMAYDRQTGISTSIGLGFGVGVHVFLVIFGFAAILSKSVLLFDCIRYVGAAYLIYIGLKALKAPKYENNNAQSNLAKKASKTPSWFNAFRIGFFTNVLNPKSVVFFTAVYAQFINPETPLFVLILYGLTSMSIEMGWFSLISTILTNQRVKNKFIAISHWIERVCGGLLIVLGVRLAVEKSVTG